MGWITIPLQYSFSLMDNIQIKRSYLWYDDGNIILQTGGKQYRVHKSIICSVSTVFKDMFDGPHFHGDETIDGYPVIHLQDDPIQLFYVLKELYPGGGGLPISYSFDQIASFLKLGDKYNIPSIRDKALYCLRHDFPSSGVVKGSTFGPGRHRLISYYEDALPILVANLVIELDMAHDILPYILICLLDQNRVAIILSEVLVSTCPRLDDLLCNGGKKLEEEILLILHSKKCLSPTTCPKIKKDFSRRTMECSYYSKGLWGMFLPFSRRYLSDLCKDCLDDLELSWDSIRKDLWKRLPIIFGIQIPLWEERSSLFPLTLASIIKPF